MINLNRKDFIRLLAVIGTLVVLFLILLIFILVRSLY